MESPSVERSRVGSGLMDIVRTFYDQFKDEVYVAKVVAEGDIGALMPSLGRPLISLSSGNAHWFLRVRALGEINTALKKECDNEKIRKIGPTLIPLIVSQLDEVRSTIVREVAGIITQLFTRCGESFGSRVEMCVVGLVKAASDPSAARVAREALNAILQNSPAGQETIVFISKLKDTELRNELLSSVMNYAARNRFETDATISTLLGVARCAMEDTNGEGMMKIAQGSFTSCVGKMKELTNKLTPAVMSKRLVSPQQNRSGRMTPTASPKPGHSVRSSPYTPATPPTNKPLTMTNVNRSSAAVHNDTISPHSNSGAKELDESQGKPNEFVTASPGIKVLEITDRVGGKTMVQMTRHVGSPGETGSDRGSVEHMNKMRMQVDEVNSMSVDRYDEYIMVNERASRVLINTRTPDSVNISETSDGTDLEKEISKYLDGDNLVRQSNLRTTSGSLPYKTPLPINDGKSLSFTDAMRELSFGGSRGVPMSEKQPAVRRFTAEPFENSADSPSASAQLIDQPVENHRVSSSSILSGSVSRHLPAEGREVGDEILSGIANTNIQTMIGDSPDEANEDNLDIGGEVYNDPINIFAAPEEGSRHGEYMLDDTDERHPDQLTLDNLETRPEINKEFDPQCETQIDLGENIGDGELNEYHVSDEQMYELMLEENRRLTEAYERMKTRQEENNNNNRLSQSKSARSMRVADQFVSTPSVYDMPNIGLTPYPTNKGAGNPWVQGSPSRRLNGSPIMAIDALGDAIGSTPVLLSKSTLRRYQIEFEDKQKEIDEAKQQLDQIYTENDDLRDKLEGVRNVVKENIERKNKIRQSIEELKQALQKGQNTYSDTYKGAETTMYNYANDLKKIADICKILSDKTRIHKQLLKTLQDELACVDAAKHNLFHESEQLKSQLSEEKTTKVELENKIKTNRMKSEIYGKETLKILDNIESISTSTGSTGINDGGASGANVSPQQLLLQAKNSFEQKKKDISEIPVLKAELEKLKSGITVMKVKLFDMISDESNNKDKVVNEIAALKKENEDLLAISNNLLALIK